MAGDELFRRNSDSESEKIVVEPLPGHPDSTLVSRGKVGVDHIYDRMVRVSKGDGLFRDTNLGEGNRARKRNSADLKAELEAVSALTVVSWNLKPWKPSTLSRDLLVRIQDAESSVENVLQVTRNVSERAAALCGELKQIDSDEESLDG